MKDMTNVIAFPKKNKRTGASYGRYGGMDCDILSYNEAALFDSHTLDALKYAMMGADFSIEGLRISQFKGHKFDGPIEIKSIHQIGRHIFLCTSTGDYWYDDRTDQMIRCYSTVPE